MLTIVATIVVPAVQNAIFTTTTKLISNELAIGASEVPVDPTTQTKTMTNNFEVTAYSIAWLGQSQPPFTTSSYTLAPFDHSMVQDSAQTYVTAATTRYWAEVDCWKPEAAVINDTSKRISFADGRGCETPDVFDDDPYWNVQNARYMAVHIPVTSPGFAFDNGNTRETNVTSMCPNFPNRFLSIWWVSGSNPDFNGRGEGLALFCDIIYYKEAGMAKVLLLNETVVSFSATEPRVVLAENDFNSSHFQRVTIDGQPPDSYSENGGYQQMALDMDDCSPITNSGRLRNLNFTVPAYTTENAGSMVSWLLALAPSTLENYLNSTILAESYDKTYQQLFALAMGRNFVSDQSAFLQDVKSETLVDAVTLVPGFLYATEALLVVTLLLFLWLTRYLSHLRLELHRNPECLARVLDLARSPAIQAKFTPYTDSDESTLKDDMGSEMFKISISSDGRPALSATSLSPSLTRRQSGNSTTTSPFVKHILGISWIVLGPTIILIAALVTSFYVLDSLSRRNSGIPLPKGNAFTIQLALSFAPTLFATLLGVYINAICRACSFMSPLQGLRKGNARAKSTLLTAYTALPPPLVFPKALPDRNYLLAALSILSVLSNILTVSIAGLFTQYNANVASTMNFTNSKEPFLSLMKDSDYQDIFDHQVDPIYTVTANVSGLTKLPTWTTINYGYLPISFDEMKSGIQNPELEFETVGYGADLDCVDFLNIIPNQSARFELRNFKNESALNFEFCYGYPDGDSVPCGPENSMHWGVDAPLSQVPNNRVAAYEVQATVSRPNNPEEIPIWNSQTNEQQIVLTWVRGRWKTKVASFPDDFNSTSSDNPYFEYNATVIACRPRLKMQKVVLRVDVEGNVLSEQLQGSPEYGSEDRFNLTNSLRASIQTVANKNPATTIGWRTNTNAQDWPNYVYKTILNSTDMLDADKPVPTFEFAGETASHAFSRIFAAQMSLDRRYLQPSNASSTPIQSATLYQTVRRVRLSYPMLVITQTILILNFVVLLVYRLTLPAPFLPRQPFTIASQIAYAAASHVVDDIAAAVDRAGEYKTSASLERELDDYRFGYGTYIGKDGMPHIGIARDPFVHKLERRY